MAEGSRRAGPGWALWLPVAAAALVAGFVAARVSCDIPFDSDEANHANIALRQFEDLRDGHFADFVRHSYRTGQFPFLHGWTLLPWFALLGPTLFAARVAQCAHFLLGAAATGWAAWRVAGDDRRAAAIGAGLFVACPLLATYGGLCMLETPGAATTALTLAVFAEACRSRGRRALVLHAATAAAALATYFTKLNYGLWIGPAIAAGHAVRIWRSSPRREALRHAAVYAGVALGVLAVWYSTSGQRAAFMGFLHNPAQETPVESDDPTFRLPGLSGANFFAYFGLVAARCHLHWTLGAAVLAAFARGVRETLRRPGVAAAAVCLVWTWLVLSMGFREYANERFIASALPALWIVAAAGAADLLRRAGARPWWPLAGLGLLAAAVGAQFAALPPRMQAEYETDTRFVPVFDFVAASVPPKSSVLVVGSTDHTSARYIEWRLGADPGRAWRDVNVVGLNSERVFESSKRLDAWMTTPRRWGAADWGTYVVEMTPGPYYPDAAIVQAETAQMWRDAVRRHEPHLVRVAERRFEELDLRVTVWRDTSPPRHLGLTGGE